MSMSWHSSRKKQSFEESKFKPTNDLIYKVEIELQIWKINSWLLVEGRNKLED